MLKEAIDKIQELSEAAWTPKRVEIEQQLRHGALLTKDGVTFYTNPDPLRAHSLNSLVDLVELCKTQGAKSIWHDEDSIIGVLSNDMRDQAVLELTKTTDFVAIESLRGKIERMPQKRFVDFLAYTLGLDKAVVQPFRRLDWRGNSGASGVAEFGASKMGKQIEATVLGIDTLPQQLVITTKMYRENVGQGTIDIRCDVEIDPQNQMLAIVPDEKDMDTAIEAVQSRIEKAINNYLGGQAIAVFFGSP